MSDLPVEPVPEGWKAKDPIVQEYLDSWRPRVERAERHTSLQVSAFDPGLQFLVEIPEAMEAGPCVADFQGAQTVVLEQLFERMERLEEVLGAVLGASSFPDNAFIGEGSSIVGAGRKSSTSLKGEWIAVPRRQFKDLMATARDARGVLEG